MNRLINKLERIRVRKTIQPVVNTNTTFTPNMRNTFNTQTIMRGTHNV